MYLKSLLSLIVSLSVFFDSPMLSAIMYIFLFFEIFHRVLD